VDPPQKNRFYTIIALSVELFVCVFIFKVNWLINAIAFSHGWALDPYVGAINDPMTKVGMAVSKNLLPVS
jgi:hypothetical protein